VDALDLMLARRSIRRFTTQDVSPDDEQKLIDAAFAAPSANNDRPWHFVVVRDAETRRRLASVHEWARMLDKAPLVIAVLGRGQGHPWWIEDCSAAAENILLEAASLGLGAVWCGVREDPDRVVGYERACCEVLGAPPDEWRALALIAVGHPAGQKKPRTQRQADKISYESFGKRSRWRRGRL
jgi:nitroreductase